jgi:hypothetical protein
MANTVGTSANRAGQINGAGDALALFLKKFAGEVLTTFTTENIFSAMHTMRTIDNGKSAQFPLTGYASAAYHTPGYDILDNSNALLSSVLHDEKVINIDSLLLSSVFVPSIDEMMNHYDVRSIYSTELGRALAKRFDQNIAKVIALGAAGSSSVTGGGKVNSISITSKGTYSVAPTTVTFSAPSSGTTATGTVVMSGLNLVGITVTNPGSGYTSAPTITISGGTGTQGTATCTIINERSGATVTLGNTTGTEPTGAQLVDGIYSAAQQLDEKNIPSEDRFCVLTPNEYYKVARSSTDLFNRFFGNTGTLSSVSLPELAGFKVARSNNLPRFGQAANTGENNTYSGDFSSLRALCFHKAAAGTVKLRDIAVESEYKIERQGTLFVSKYAMGHGSLRPEAAVLVNRTA